MSYHALTRTALDTTQMFDGKSILIVEDEPTVRALLEKMVVQLGFTTVDLASDGSDALKHIDRSSYSVILCDLHMLPMNGHEFLKTLRGGGTRFGPQKAAIPMIFLTQSSDRTDVEQAKSSGVQGYLLKPVRFNDLRTRLSAVLGVRS